MKPKKIVRLLRLKWEHKAILNFIEYIDKWYGIDEKLKKAMIAEENDQYKRKPVEKF